jgi:hypothetical protein
MGEAELRFDKGSKLYLQPAELARKLVKEMEDHKVSRSAHVSVRNRYTIFLCPEDYERLRDHEEQLMVKLERHLSKHVRSKKYEISGDIRVAMTVDHDLRLGRFGILAERNAPGFAEQDLPVRLRQEQQARAESVVSARAEVLAAARAEVLAPARAERVALAPAARLKTVRAEPVDGATKIIAAADAADLGLARQTIVISSGNHVKEYNQGRVILGRARDVDFVIDNPDVSRRHAVLSWSNGDIVLEDLGSTNGTMVNGYPISSTVVGPGDVVVIGDCRLTVAAR